MKKTKTKTKTKMTKAKAMFNETNRYFDRCKNDKTRKIYIVNFRNFLRYCSMEHKCEKLDECKEHIHDYTDYLTAQKKSASTVHTYIAPVCRYFGVNIS